MASFSVARWLACHPAEPAIVTVRRATQFSRRGSQSTGTCKRQASASAKLGGEPSAQVMRQLLFRQHRELQIRTHSPSRLHTPPRQERFSKSTGRGYFYNKRTGGSTWEWPTARHDASTRSREVGAGDCLKCVRFGVRYDRLTNNVCWFSIARTPMHTHTHTHTCGANTHQPSSWRDYRSPTMLLSHTSRGKP
jgi:hypothetical protein